MAFAEGQWLGPYQIQTRLGHGGMATVYKGYHARLDRNVAIKVIHQAFVQDAASVARFEREAQIVARLDHPHIVPIYDFAEYEGQPYLVMKYVDGLTLKALLSKAPLTLESIVGLMSTVASAVDYAHSQGVLHRDIKPSNILIDREGVPYVTDFGLARIAHAGESTLSANMLLGTPQYISPEQAMGNRDLTPQSDLYSLAIVLYELVVGQVPFHSDTPYAIVHEQIYSPLPAPRERNPNISPAVEAVLVKALAKNPSDRYPSAAALVDAFRAAVADVAPATLHLPVAPSVRPAASPSAPAVTPASEPPKERIEKSKRSSAGDNVEFRFDFGQLGDQLRDMFEGWDASSGESDLANDALPTDEEQSIRRRIEQGYKKRNELFMHAAIYAVINLMMVIIYAASGGIDFSQRFGMGDFPWPLIVAFGWGAGLMAHAVDTYFQTGARAAKQDRIIDQAMRAQFGDGWQRTATKKQYNKARQKALKPYRKRVELLEHLATFIPINLMLWFIYLSNAFGMIDPVASGEAADFPWPLIVTLGWGAGLVAHLLDVYFGSDARTASREQAVQREVERELQQRDRRAFEKPKRDVGIRLNEDGELTDSIAELWEVDDAAQRDRR